MEECPVCGSEKIRGSKELGFKCPCGFETYPNEVLLHNRVNGGVTNSKGISPLITISSPLFQAIHDLHNNGWKFKINEGSVNVVSDKGKGFKGKGTWLEVDGRNIHATKNWLKIYKTGRNKLPLIKDNKRELEEASNRILASFVEVAKRIAFQYNLIIDLTPVAMGNRPEIKTPFLSANNFVEKEAQAVYTPPSPIELKGPNAVLNSYNLTETLANLTQLTQLEIQNKQLHQAVLVEMKDTLKTIQLNVQRPPGLTDKIKSVLGLWLAKIRPKPRQQIKG